MGTLNWKRRFAHLLFLSAMLSALSSAQTFTILHSFNLSGVDGARPSGGVLLDRAGNLYGTTSGGGTRRGGEVFRMSPHSGGWTLQPLFSFDGRSDGAWPDTDLTFGPDGKLYGATMRGGILSCNPGYGCGVVFSVQPPLRSQDSVLGGWTESVLYAFPGDENYSTGDVVFDSAGNLYGWTSHATGGNSGGIYQLVPAGNHWIVSIIYLFTGRGDGQDPRGSMVFDSAGNLYGVTNSAGAYNKGTIFKLTPTQSGWVETTLHSFQGVTDGEIPFAGLSMDHAGNIIGTTASGGINNGGTVFQLTPQAGGGWSYSILYAFQGVPSGGPNGAVAMDAAGNLYGVMQYNGIYHNNGSVFKLSFSDGNWHYTDLHSFNGADGRTPLGSVAVDAAGNVYGATYDGGAYGYGVVWEVTP